jgi:hypothetical protein
MASVRHIGDVLLALSTSFVFPMWLTNYTSCESNDAMIIGVSRFVRLYLLSPGPVQACTREGLSSSIHSIVQGVQAQMQLVVCNTPREVSESL